mmetsp:Transcript_121866/g.345401  ORF Transcript_121866/g.345401 Transcript_121866/m.345401 type:complete len:201 (-) Transcript_121866:603-1205(-)
MRHYAPFDLANTLWAYARSDIFHETLFNALAAQSRAQMSEFSQLGLANTAWAFANLSITDRTLLQAISSAARNIISDFTTAGSRRVDLVAFALGLLGMAWAHAFMEVCLDGFGIILERALAAIGAEVDSRDRQVAASLPHADPEPAVRRPASKEPHTEIDLRGMVVVHKQPDWEVDGAARPCGAAAAGEAPLPLSSWLRA